MIAVNETHAVFSIRIERAKLAEYHFFLNVISDIAGGDGRLQMPPRSAPPTPKSKWRKAATLFAIVAAMSGIPLVEMADATGNQPPLKILSAEFLIPTAYPGGELILKAVTQRTRVCPATVTRVIMREKDGASVHQESIPAIAVTDATPNPSTWTVAVRIPNHLTPGRYRYRATLLSDCGDRSFATHQPTLPFEVLEAPTSDPALLTDVPVSRPRRDATRGAILR